MIKKELIIIGVLFVSTITLTIWHYQDKEALKNAEELTRTSVGLVTSNLLKQRNSDSLKVVASGKKVDSLQKEYNKLSKLRITENKYYTNELYKAKHLTPIQRNHIADSLARFINNQN